MLNLDEKFGYDLTKAKKGEKLIVGPNSAEDYILVRFMKYNDDYAVALQEAMLEHSDALEALRVVDKKAAIKMDRHIHNQVMGATVVSGWGTSIGIAGKHVKYSPTAATKILDDTPILRDLIMEFAAEPSNYPQAPRKLSADRAKKS